MTNLSPHVLASKWSHQNCCFRCSPAHVERERCGRAKVAQMHPGNIPYQVRGRSEPPTGIILPNFPAQPIVIKPMLFQQFWRDPLWQLHVSPTCVRVHTFWGIVFLFWSNEISTFFDLLMDQGAHFVTVHAFGSIFGESHFLHWSNEISTILIFRSICMLHRAPI